MQQLQKKVYIQNLYEEHTDEEGIIKKIHYLYGSDGVFGIYVDDENEGESIFYTLTDHLGSINIIADENGERVEELSFDAWGNRRNPDTWQAFQTAPSSFLFDRGYTGHEHLDKFELINMNGRVYDPILGRFLSPDPYIQMPDFSQNYNRYSYALNNPLIYTDPDGEFLQLPFLVGVVLTNIVSNYLNGVSDPIISGFNDGVTFVNEFANCAQFPIYQDDNTTVTAGIDPFNVGVSVNAYHTEGDFTFGASAGVGMIQKAYANSSITYKSGDFSFTAGGGYSSGNLNIFNGSSTPGGSRIYGGMSYFDRPNNQYFSGGLTYFSGVHSQYNWFGGYNKGDFSLSTTNDAWVGGDKFRTGSFEVGVGDYSIGFNLYTTPPPEDEYKLSKGGNKMYKSPIYGSKSLWGTKGTYSSGSRIHAALYLGYRNGNTVSRIGVDAPWVQDVFQNGIHWLIGNPFFNTNYGPSTRLFTQGGFYFPYSLYLH